MQVSGHQEKPHHLLMDLATVGVCTRAGVRNSPYELGQLVGVKLGARRGSIALIGSGLLSRPNKDTTNMSSVDK